MIDVYTFCSYFDLILPCYLSGSVCVCVCCLSVLHHSHSLAHLPTCCNHFTTASPQSDVSLWFTLASINI